MCHPRRLQAQRATSKHHGARDESSPPVLRSPPQNSSSGMLFALVLPGEGTLSRTIPPTLLLQVPDGWDKVIKWPRAGPGLGVDVPENCCSL